MISPIEVFFISIVITLPLTIFWMIVAWRAMQAHEKLADSIEKLASQNDKRDQQSNLLGENKEKK